MTDKPKGPYNLTPDGLRRRQEAARRTKPWKHSTGPKTPEGMRRSSMNALWFGDTVKKLENVDDVAYLRALLPGAILDYLRSQLDWEEKPGLRVANRLDQAQERIYRVALRLRELDPEDELAVEWVRRVEEFRGGRES